MGRQTTNYKKRAIFQIQDEIKKLKKEEGNQSLIKKLNKIKSTIEKIKYPQTRKEVNKKQ